MSKHEHDKTGKGESSKPARRLGFPLFNTGYTPIDDSPSTGPRKLPPPPKGKSALRIIRSGGENSEK